MSPRFVNIAGTAVPLDAGDLVGYPVPLLDDTIISTSRRTQVTITGATTPDQLTTPGAWVEVDASLSTDATGVWVAFLVATATSGAETSTLVDIGVGPSGSEAVWATVGAGYNRNSATLWVPGGIPAGSRVAMRVARAVQSDKSIIIQVGFTAGSRLSVPHTYGVNLSTALGTLINYSGTPDTVSAWTEVTPSTTDDIDVLGTFIQGGAQSTMSAPFILVDIGVGPSGSEVPVVKGLSMSGSVSEELSHYMPRTFTVPTIPAGARLAARWQATNGTLAAIDVALVGAALL